MTADRSARVVAGPGSALEIAGISDRGPVRTENQDIWDALVHAGGERAVLVLADGMGGHAGGGDAAEAAVAPAMRVLGDAGRASADALVNAVDAANLGVAEVRVRIGGFPGTTLVMAVIDGMHATVANIGDSRAYLVHGTSIRQLTDDHSWVGEQVRAGAIDAAEVRHHMKRNIITRAVMGDPVAADQFDVDAEPGDVLLLCSDGLWEPVADAALAILLDGDVPLAAAVERACDAALAAGGTDNVTMVAARWRAASDKV